MTKTKGYLQQTIGGIPRWFRNPRDCPSGHEKDADAITVGNRVGSSHKFALIAKYILSIVIL